MAIVKGSKQCRVKVVEDRPLFRWTILIACLGLTVLAVFVSHQRGFSSGMVNQEAALKELARYESQLFTSEKRVNELEQKVANHTVGAEVDRKANESVRQEVIVLKEEIAVLTEENSFYRGLMAPTKNKRGLSFGVVELSQSERTRTYNYKVVMQQLATNHSLLNGTLLCKVVGRANGKDVEYNLNQLSSQLKTDVIKLRFKYFQTVEGQLQLPEGFEPLRIELVAKSTGKNPVTVEKRFGWLVEEVL